MAPNDDQVNDLQLVHLFLSVKQLDLKLRIFQFEVFISCGFDDILWLGKKADFRSFRHTDTKQSKKFINSPGMFSRVFDPIFEKLVKYVI